MGDTEANPLILVLLVVYLHKMYAKTTDLDLGMTFRIVALGFSIMSTPVVTRDLNFVALHRRCE